VKVGGEGGEKRERAREQTKYESALYRVEGVDVVESVVVVAGGTKKERNGGEAYRSIEVTLARGHKHRRT
jgi:hypothetical protein